METSSVHNQIRMLLIQDFNPVFIEVTDDSARHQGHAGARAGDRTRHSLNKAELEQSPRPGGGNSHFRVKMVAESFNGKSLIKRHQAVYRSLDAFLKSGVHALQMELLSVEEWHARGQS